MAEKVPAAQNDQGSDGFSTLYRNAVAVTLVWILIVAGSFSWSVYHERKHTLEMARNEARSAFNKDLALRLWATSHGGVYVTPDDRTPPNPYLSHLPDRDVLTLSGKKLTLMNPAYMLRQTMQDYEKLYGVKGHITSLKLLNPMNMPDEWQRKALNELDRGAAEVAGVAEIRGEKYLRLMRPMLTKKGCLKCHGHQGYTVGDVRGGVGVSVPMMPYYRTEYTIIKNYLWTNGAVLLAGLLAIGFVSFRSKKRISEKHEADKKLRESEERMSLLFNSLPDFIVQVGTDMKVVWANQCVTEVKPDAVGQYCYRVFRAASRLCPDCPVRQCMESGTIVSEELAYEGFTEREGETWWSLTGIPLKDESGTVTGAIEVCRNITDRVEMEASLRQSQKMEAIGTLAGGIAHDFNNILGGIIGYTELVQGDVPQGSRVQDDLKEIIKSADRAKDLVRQILTFSRKSRKERKTLSIAPIIQEAVKLLRSTIPTTVEIRPAINEQSGMVNADATQMHQVMMNLCTNAAHAMQETDGVLDVSLNPVVLSEESMGIYHDLTPGPYVELRIADNGAGIDPRILPRIFEPFFTTKEQQKGTGMGLAVVHGIVKDHGGEINVESRVGAGTTFTILLPRVIEQPAADGGEQTEAEGGSGHILFVDDEKTLMDIGRRILESLGYTVTACNGSLEALDVFQQSPDEFDLVITDQTMPHMTGYNLAKRILRIKPSMSVILCTGYSDSLTPQKARDAGSKALLYKPFSRKDVARTVHDVLSADN